MIPTASTTGFWHAHIGWIMFWRHRTNYNNVKDLRRSRLVPWQHDHHAWWSVGGRRRSPHAHRVVDRASAGRIHHGGLPAHHRRSCIRRSSSIRSRIRSARNPTTRSNSSRDNWLCALLTNGEGFHNYPPPVPVGLPQRLPLVSLGSVEVDHLRAVEGRPRLGPSQDFRRSESPRPRRTERRRAESRAGADRRRRTRASCNPRARHCRPDAPTA